MKTKLYLFLSILIIGSSLFLRLYKMENRAPFDWDQNRDYQAISAIASGKYTLIGPVAKGEGGFFLGPLYYYLTIPAFTVLQRSPSALPVTSILFDVFAVCAILLLFRKVLGDHSTLFLATLWSFSWFTIEMSRISWNVALLPLWSVILLWLLTREDKLSLLSACLLGIVVGLSWHIHAAIIPLSLAVVIFSWRLWARDLKNILVFLIGYLIPLVPLILFDLRHSGINYYLLSQMLMVSTKSSFNLVDLLSAIMMRLGKNTQALLLGMSSYNLALGYVVTFISFVGLFTNKRLFRLSSLIILLNVLAVFALKEAGFPEYYFAISYIPTMAIFTILVSKILQEKTILLIILTLILVYLNIRRYSYQEASFGLSRKIKVARMIADLNTPVDLHLVTAPGREGGISAFYKQYGGKLDPQSPVKIVVTDQVGGPIILNGELTSVIGKFGELRVSKFIVQ